MKKHLLLAAGVLLSASVYAQDEIVIRASKQISKEATPKQIIDSLKKRFPDAKSVAYYQTSSNAAKNGWQVSEEDNLRGGEELQKYTLSFKRADFKHYALFEPDGKLIKSKFQQYGADLPDAAKASLKTLAGNDYKNYTILSKTYYKTVDYDSKKNYYEVVAVNKTNTKIKKKITLDDTGKVIKVK